MELISNYKPLFDHPSFTRYFLLTGGRGSAKSFHVSTFLLNLTYEPNEVILFTRWTMTSAHISIIPEFLEKIDLLNLQDDFEIKQGEIINKKTGSRILFKGIKTSQGTATANLKSIVGVTCWVLDEAEELTDKETFDKIDLSIRVKNKSNRVIMVMNPSNKAHWIYNHFVKTPRKDTTYIHTTYKDNIQNLSESYLENAANVKEQNPDRYGHLFLGEWLEESEGILWNRAIVERSRIKTHPFLKQTIVAIDPATTANANSDETGIVVVGKCENDKFYVLDDLSGRYSPQEWAKVAAQAFRNYDCSFYVAEKNQGGDMVKAVLANEDKNNLIRLVTATKGKYTRAEPIYQLYEQHQVFHVGSLPILENQMVSFNPDSNEKSPDRVDALVWGLTELNKKSDFKVFY